MKIIELIKGLDIKIEGNIEKDISGITYDSRKVSKNYLFAAMEGSKDDGKKYIKDAISKGAAAILTDNKEIIKGDATYLLTDNVSDSLAKMSSRFYNEPSRNMKFFAITGTNGKTTTSYLIEKIFQTAGIKLGVIGTIFYRFDTLMIPAPNTTPQSSDLQEILSKMKQCGADGVVVEVSSHGLVQNRISGCDIDVAIFTNLTQDHLDYHKTMDEYKKAKFLLFEEFLTKSAKEKKYAIINTDDEAGKELLNITKGDVITYGIKSDAQIRATEITILRNKTEFFVQLESKKVRIETKLVGQHNVYNILAAFSCAYSQKVDFKDIVNGIKEFETVPGRFETIDKGQPFTVIIDYAHTPDALLNLINAAKTIKHKRIITVFGCGGDRDRSKRPLMGEISGRLSDYTIITSDNPRFEKQERIALDVEVGLQNIKCKNYEVILDRAEAVRKAISICEIDDILLIAGKGHEEYQVIGDEKIPYNDKDVASRILSERYDKKNGKNRIIKNHRNN
ncbi:MAG: UDP-N-acetylmuramoyl-L-alanyl-D-glutamate--2,6-diaminopimelate ligase [Elusimicrobia bacterium]|nr:UDP-N-acetylmuramoyl-L-alanyl-D-glutamate--2,6-diaminopimelate ligase [Elusimicrobiota bacterium]